MKKKTIGILATSVAVCALCIVTDASAIAKGGGGGGRTAEVVGMAEVVVGTAEAVATAGAVAFMDLLPMVAAGTLVMGGVAMLTAFRRTPTTDMDLLVTP